MALLENQPVAVARDADARRGRLLAPGDLWIAASLAAAAILVLLPAWTDILRLGWRDEELSYVLIAPVVIGWLGWVRRQQLFGCRLKGGWVGVLIVLLGWAIYTYGYFADPVLHRAGAVVVAIGAFLAALGSDALLKLAPAFAACIFLIPVSPDGRYHIAVPLQTATAHATQTACDLLGIYVDRSARTLTINGVAVNVQEACNGMRMVITLLMVCYVVAFTMELRTPIRIAILLLSPLIAVAFNVVRLVPTVWMFGNSSVEKAERFHTISGWAMTVLAFGVLMGIAWLLQRAMGTSKSAGKRA